MPTRRRGTPSQAGHPPRGSAQPTGRHNCRCSDLGTTGTTGSQPGRTAPSTANATPPSHVRPECLVTNPGGGAIGVLAFGPQQRHPWPGVVVAELAPPARWPRPRPSWPNGQSIGFQVTSSTNQRSVGPALLINGTHPLTGPAPRA